MWGQFMYPPDDGLTLGQALTYLPKEHQGQVAAQAARLEEMEAARGAREYVHVPMRANYAQEIFKVMNSLISGTKNYARLVQTILRGDKRRTHIQLQSILERVILPSAYENLDHPRFYPIRPAEWPGYQPDRQHPRINERGRKIECCHSIKGVPVWIEYDGVNQEPSYWICYAPDEKYTYVIHYWNPAEAVAELLRRMEEHRQTVKNWKSKRYNLSELSDMKQWELHEIARHRGISPRKKSIGRLRAEIVQPQAILW